MTDTAPSDEVAAERTLRQRVVLSEIIERAASIDAIEGLIVIGSFAAGEPDDLSDLDLLAVAAPGRLDEAWEARHELSGVTLVAWEPHSNAGQDIRWLNWLTSDLVKVECGVAAPGSKELAEPFLVVAGPASLADRFPRIAAAAVRERAAQRAEQQSENFDPADLTAEERLGWALSEFKQAARALIEGPPRP